METRDEVKNSPTSLQAYLSPINVWALSLGCAVGWGAFVMPGSTFLPIAGPLGTFIAMIVGGAMMLIIGYNYHYMMNRYSDAGGTYSYSKNILGYDHGFLSAWFLMLVYLAIIWANATAIPLICRNLFGDIFQVGFHYKFVGYDIYFGEALLSLSAIWILGLICIYGKKFSVVLQTLAACVLFFGVLICFTVIANQYDGNIFFIEPQFSPEHSPTLGVLGVIILAPWAFAGFESISNSTEEFKFSTKKTFLIMSASVISGTLIYALLSIMSASVLPTDFSDWTEYINNLNKLSGLEGLPTFHAVNEKMGNTGVIILSMSVAAGVITGLIGNFIAASRLLYSMVRDNIFPSWLGKLNKSFTPRNALLFLMLISLPIPFLGRTAIGWIIDVNTLGATIAYSYTSAVAFRKAKIAGDIHAQITGGVGYIISNLLFLYFMIPNFWTVTAMSTASYLIFIGWSILGFIFFRYIFRRDTQRRFGKSTIVWIVLLFINFFTLMMWIRQSMYDTTNAVLGNLNDYYESKVGEYGITLDRYDKFDIEYYLQQQMDIVTISLTRKSMIQMFLIIIILMIMFNIYNLMMQREKNMELQKVEAEHEKAEAERDSKAKTTFLSNMSHDIRTPMNAIVGYTVLAKKDPNLSEGTMDFLNKIEASSHHLLALINDVLDMSRIESGKMELDITKTNLIKAMDDVHDLFATQMEMKSISYTVNCENVSDKIVMCDVNRLNRVLLNLISNAYKFTPDGGSISVNLSEIGAAEGFGNYELRVKDTGIGMSPEFAATVFEAYTRDRLVNNIQGTGLGMAITKSIVELMNGNIRVETEQGKGTEFIINVSFELVEASAIEGDEENVINPQEEINFADMKLLLVEDNIVNREIASLILTEYGFSLDTAENGKEAVEKISASKPGDFDAVLMDIQMPVMNGYEATKKIRALDNPALANIPIIAMTANAFTEDIQAAKDAGMDAHIAKPIDIPNMLETLTEIFNRTK